MRVPAKGDLESGVTDIEQVRRRVHDHNACTCSARERRSGSGRAAPMIVQSANPHITVRSREANVAIGQKLNPGTLQPLLDVTVVRPKIVVSENGETTERRFDFSEALGEGVDMALVQADIISTEQEHLRLQLLQRSDRGLQKPLVSRGAGVKIGGKSQPQRRVIGARVSMLQGGNGHFAC